MSHHITESDYGTGQKTLGVYTFGILLCVILTLIPFGVVEYVNASNAVKLTVVFLSAILQFLTQVVCFLRLNYTTEQSKMNVLSFLLAIFTLLVVVIGSIWIMVSLNYRMMH